nr:MAG TPA: hypothetical protein [Caudoviricetes sp.]
MLLLYVLGNFSANALSAFLNHIYQVIVITALAAKATP